MMKARFILFVLALYSCVAFAALEGNPTPSAQIEVIGTLPEDVEAVLVEDWYTTTDSIFVNIWSARPASCQTILRSVPSQ